jgi:hypothetical protein
MIVQPLVCEHASKKHETERCMSFGGLNGTRVPPFTVTQEFESEACLLHCVGSEGDTPKTDREVNDVPDTQKDSGRLEQGRHQEGTDGVGQIWGWRR